MPLDHQPTPDKETHKDNLSDKLDEKMEEKLEDNQAGKKGRKGLEPVQLIRFNKTRALELLTESPNNISYVVKRLGVSRPCWYWHLSHDPQFAIEVQEIREAACDALESNMYDLGMKKSFKTFNDRIAYLRAYRPQLYNPVKVLKVEGYQIKDKTQRIGAIEGAIDATIVREYQDRTDRREAKRLAGAEARERLDKQGGGDGEPKTGV